MFPVNLSIRIEISWFSLTLIDIPNSLCILEDISSTDVNPLQIWRISPVGSNKRRLGITVILKFCENISL